jgi:indole-3-glycerol phosphate synthase
VSTPSDVAAMRAAGVDAVLVGEAVMRAPDPAERIRELLAGD